MGDNKCRAELDGSTRLVLGGVLNKDPSIDGKSRFVGFLVVVLG